MNAGPPACGLGTRCNTATPDYVWFDVRIEFYEAPESRTGYRGAASRGGFRSVCLPRIGELLVSPAITVGDLPGSRVMSVDHMIDTVHDVEGGEPSVMVVAHVRCPDPLVIEQMRSTGWRIDRP